MRNTTTAAIIRNICRCRLDLSADDWRSNLRRTQFSPLEHTLNSLDHAELELLLLTLFEQIVRLLQRHLTRIAIVDCDDGIAKLQASWFSATSFLNLIIECTVFSALFLNFSTETNYIVRFIRELGTSGGISCRDTWTFCGTRLGGHSMPPLRLISLFVIFSLLRLIQSSVRRERELIFTASKQKRLKMLGENFCWRKISEILNFPFFPIFTSVLLLLREFPTSREGNKRESSEKRKNAAKKKRRESIFIHRTGTSREKSLHCELSFAQARK